MSFTSNIKTEIANISTTKLEQLSELAGFLKNSKDGKDNLKISTENAALARLTFNRLKENYDALIRVSVKKGYNYNKNYIYGLDVYKNKDIIIKDLSLDKNIPDKYLLDDEDTKRAYIRGVFLAVGSINDPKTSRYHMELSFDNLEYANFINDLLLSYNLNSKLIKRESRYTIYIKESEKITDFLRIINATSALLYYENIRIYRNKKNNINRLNNCEQANVDKIILTAKKQIDDINYIKQEDAYDLLDDKVKQACEYRLKYPEESLLELSKIMTLETQMPITKSGLHHRFDKLKKLVDRMKENKSQDL